MSWFVSLMPVGRESNGFSFHKAMTDSIIASQAGDPPPPPPPPFPPSSHHYHQPLMHTSPVSFSMHKSQKLTAFLLSLLFQLPFQIYRIRPIRLPEKGEKFKGYREKRSFQIFLYLIK